MKSVRLNFLGVPLVQRGEAAIQLTRAKGLALLVYLAVTRVPHSRERLLDLLWPESLPQAARKNLRNTLWAIRESLGEDVLELEGATIRLSAAVSVDVHAMEDGLLLLEGGTAAELEAAVAQYRGPLAEGLIVQEAPGFEIWLAGERERMAAIALRLLERCRVLRRSLGDWQAVIRHARHALAIDPLLEAAHLDLIEAHVRLGQRSQAAQQYAALTEVLRRELDVAPLPETIARYEALLGGAGAPVVRTVVPRARATAAPASPFVGRQTELLALVEEQLRAAAGDPRVALIAGDLGVGKTRLLQEWSARLPAEAVVLATHALETSQPMPFGPIATLFRHPGPLRSLTHPPSALKPIWLAELTRLLPELASSWPDLRAPLAVSPLEERARLFQALTEAVRLLPQPLVVLIVDDLHWADPSTLDWLVYLIDHLREMPLLLVGTYRPQEAGTQLVGTIAGWQRQGRLRQIALSPLTEDEGYALLSALDPVGEHDRHDYWLRQSGGNPYFLVELCRSGSAEPPDSLASLVRARLQTSLSAGAYQVLQAAAVIGDAADAAMLRAVSGRSEEETLDALDELVRALVLTERHGTYAFVHPLVAGIIEQELTAARRVFLHRRAIQMLERANEHRLEQVAGQLMHHYAVAGDLRRAAHYADRAAAQARTVSALHEASAFQRQALNWEPTPQRQLDLGELLIVAGVADEAHALLHDVLHQFEAQHNAVGATRACLSLARIAIMRSQPDVARSLLHRAPLERAQALDPALAVQGHLWAASVERFSRAYDAALAQLQEANRLLQVAPRPLQASQSAFERGNVLADQGELEAAVVSFEEALHHAYVAEEPVQQAMTHNNLAYHTMLLGRYAVAQEHLQAGIALAERFALGLLWQYLYSTAGELALARGQLDEAEEFFERALEAARAWTNQVHIANVRLNQALIAKARGDIEQARALLLEAQNVFGAAIDPHVQQKLLRYRAEFDRR